MKAKWILKCVNLHYTRKSEDDIQYVKKAAQRQQPPLQFSGNNSSLNCVCKVCQYWEYVYVLISFRQFQMGLNNKFVIILDWKAADNHYTEEKQ